MFSSDAVDYTEFPSSWKKKSDLFSTEVQTDPVRWNDIGVQNRTYSDVQVQAVVNGPLTSVPRAFDMPSVQSFVKKAFPVMTAELERSSRSTALLNYSSGPDKDSGQFSAKPFLHLSFPRHFHCTGISWNATGSVVALSCSIANHDGWCVHDSCAFLWNLHRQPTSECKPSSILNTECCLSSLAFHPVKPAILTAGTVHGDVLLWDLGQDMESWLTSSSTVKGEHQDAVTGIHWSPDVNADDVVLSSSLDGKILYWKCKQHGHQLEPKERFVILTENMPQAMKIKSGTSNSVAGVTAISLNKFDPALFVIGTEGGALLQGSLMSSKQVPYASGLLNDTFKCPIVTGFQPHSGHTTDVHYSPFSRNVFLSAGTDHAVKVFSLLQVNTDYSVADSEIPDYPLLSYGYHTIFQVQPTCVIQMAEVVTKVRWSPTQPVLFTVLQRNGQLKMFDTRSLSLPYAEITPGSQHYNTSALEYCAHHPNLVCAAQDDGSAQIWQLGNTLRNKTDNFETATISDARAGILAM